MDSATILRYNKRLPRDCSDDAYKRWAADTACTREGMTTKGCCGTCMDSSAVDRTWGGKGRRQPASSNGT